jgi:RimJ/RimL family protein N-acetyltransferase
VNVDEEFVRARTTEATLRDGSRIRMRPILPDDKACIVDGFRRLSPESRYRRFLSPIEELTDEQLRFLTEIDYVDHFAWLALSLDEAGMPGVGVARYVRSPDQRDVAEAAVTVVDDYQGRGLGTLLLELLGAVALEQGVRRFRSYALEENRPILALLRSLGATIQHEAPGIARVEMDLPARADRLRGSPMYEVLRAVARGDGPVLITPSRLASARNG